MIEIGATGLQDRKTSVEQKENILADPELKRKYPQKPIRLSVSLFTQEYAELQALAKKNSISMAWMARQAVLEFLSRYNSDEVQLPLKLSKGRN